MAKERPHATKYPGVRRRPGTGSRQVFDAYFSDNAGRQIWKRGFPTAFAANAWRQENLRRVRNHGWEQPERQTLDEFLEAHITARGLRGKQVISTQERQRELLRVHISPALGQVAVHELQPIRLQAFLDDLLRTLAPATVQQIYALLRAAYRQARKRRLLHNIPTDGVDLPEMEEPEIYLPTDEELLAIQAELEPLYRPIVELDSLTGLRRGEILGLRWSAVRLQDGFLDVREQLQERKDGTLEFRKPKSKTSVRPVMLEARAVEILEAVRQDQLQRQDLLGQGWQDYGLVFDSGTGEPIIPGTLTQAYSRAAKRLQIPTRFHDLRHLAITRWVEAGINVGTVSNLAGHSSVSFTMARYFEPRESAQEEARDLVEQSRTSKTTSRRAGTARISRTGGR